MNQIIKFSISTIIGGLIGTLVTFSIMRSDSYGGYRCRVLYVSQNELMELEQARIKDNKLEDKQLFYGVPEKAAKLATELPKQYVNANTKVVYSMDKVIGKDVKSISGEIHKGIIAELVKSANRVDDKPEDDK